MTNLGLRTHMRNCICKRVRKKKGTSVWRNTLPVQLGGSGARLGCDDVLFRNLETDNAETFLIPSENDPLKLVEPSRLSNSGSEECVERQLATSLAHLSQRAGKKEINKIMNTLRHPSFSLGKFQADYLSAEDCLNMVDSEFSLKSRKFGFRCIPIEDKDTGICYEFYMRSPVDVLRSQIELASSKTTSFEVPFMDQSEQPPYCHPMMAKLGQSAIPIVRDIISSSNKPEVYWHMPAESGESSFVGLIQIYTDKSKTTLKSSGFQFYPVHINLLNYSEEHRRRCIVNGLTFTAFLPVKFYTKDGNNWVQTGVSRELKLAILHKALSYILQEIKDVAYKGFSCNDIEYKKRRCHPCVALYTCDLPEGKDMTSIKNGNSSKRNCHRCLAETSDFNSFTSASRRMGSETKYLIEQYFKVRETESLQNAKLVLNDVSLSPQIPWLLGFPFVGAHESLDLHSLFGYEVLHNLHLGVSKDLKRCLSERLRSTAHFTSSVPTKAGNIRHTTFKAVRNQVLAGVNAMLSHMERTSPSQNLRIDFSVGKDYSSGLFGEDGKLIGMLEAKDYKSVDMISPFIGMFVDRCCGKDNGFVNTRVFVLYADMVSMMLCYDKDPIWNEKK